MSTQGNDETAAPESAAPPAAIEQQRPLSQLYEEMEAEAAATREDPDVAAAASPDGPAPEVGEGVVPADPAAAPAVEGEPAVEAAEGEPAADPNARTNADLERRDAELIQQQQQFRGQLQQAQNIQQAWQTVSQMGREDPLGAARQMGFDTARLMQQMINDDGPEPPPPPQQPDPNVVQNRQLASGAFNEIRKLRLELALEKRSSEFPLLAQMADEGSPVIDQIVQRQAQGEPLTQIAEQLEGRLTEATFGALGKLKDNDQFRGRLATLLGMQPTPGNGTQQPATTPPPPAAPAVTPPAPAKTLRQDMAATPPQSEVGEPKTVEEARAQALAILNSQPLFIEEDEAAEQAEINRLLGLGKKE